MRPSSSWEWICAGAFKLRGVLMVPPLAFTFLHFDARFEESAAEWIIGGAAFAIGVGFRVVAQRHLRYRLHGERALARTGPYRAVRNPVYLGNLFILAGLAFMAELPWMAPVLVAWGGVVYSLAIRFEETRLLKRYGGEYAAYMTRSPRWVPHLEATRGVAPDEVSTWLRAARAEWPCLTLIVFPVVKELLEHLVLPEIPRNGA